MWVDQQQHLTECESKSHSNCSYHFHKVWSSPWWLPLSFQPRSLHRFISPPLYSLTPPPALLFSSSLPPSSAPSILRVYPLKSFVKLSSALSQEFSSYTEGVSGVFIKPGLSGSLFMCNLLTRLYCSLFSESREKRLKIKTFYRLLQGTQRAPVHSHQDLYCDVEKMEVKQNGKERS